ncbi:MAG: class II aldolase/adducin family protein [Elusimicrobia bacterium]|nr:class II aldolase/adducin family protein [Elusimicrobiota bacterium]
MNKELLLSYGKRMHNAGYLREADGNLSVRCAAGASLYITSAGKNKGALRLFEIVEVGLHGKRSSGHEAPSSDLPIHLAIYRSCPKFGAVLHAHSPRAVRLAQSEGSGPELPCVEQPSQIPAHIAASRAVLLKNHGIYVAGKNLEEAWRLLEKIERPTAKT